MSADNGIYIAEFPTKAGLSGGSCRGGTLEWRVKNNGSESVINELETHYFTPEEHRQAVMDMWCGEVFTREDDAWDKAREYESEGWTEYGICKIRMPVPWGELREPIAKTPIPPHACKWCSSDFTWAYHDSETCEKNPETPFAVVLAALKEHTSGIHEYVITRLVVEALEAKNLLTRKVKS